MENNQKINNIMPREQVGAKTPERFEYQYCLAANECFLLLENTDALCVFCEWHDDFVTEYKYFNPETIYAFSQVKTKGISKAWTIPEIFGAGGQKKGLDKDSPFFRMLQNYLIFKDSCHSFIFLTNAGINDDLNKFLKEIKEIKTHDDFKEKKFVKVFYKLWEEYKTFYTGDIGDFFKLLKLFDIKPEIGKLEDQIKILRLNVLDKVKEYCEFDLKNSEAELITSDIVKLVEQKSRNTLKTAVDRDELILLKGIVIDDVFKFLAISTEGLKGIRALQGSPKEKTIFVSRLERLCERNEIPKNMVSYLCKLKADWDTWILAKKFDFKEEDLKLLIHECTKVLSEKVGLEEIGAKAQVIMKFFNPKINENLQLTEMLIIGLIFSLAAQYEGGLNE